MAKYEKVHVHGKDKFYNNAIWSVDVEKISCKNPIYHDSKTKFDACNLKIRRVNCQFTTAAKYNLKRVIFKTVRGRGHFTTVVNTYLKGVFWKISG